MFWFVVCNISKSKKIELQVKKSSTKHTRFIEGIYWFLFNVKRDRKKIEDSACNLT